MPTQRIVLLSITVGLAVSLSAQSSLTLDAGPVLTIYEASVSDPHADTDVQDGLNGWNIGATFITPWMNKANAHLGFLIQGIFQHRDFSMSEYQGGLGSGGLENLSVTTTGAELHLAPWWSFPANGRFRFSVGPSVYFLLDSHMSGQRVTWDSRPGPFTGVYDVEGSADHLLVNTLGALTTQLHYTVPIGKHLGLDMGIRVSRTFNSILVDLNGVQAWDFCISGGLNYAFGK